MTNLFKQALAEATELIQTGKPGTITPDSPVPDPPSSAPDGAPADEDLAEDRLELREERQSWDVQSAPPLPRPAIDEMAPLVAVSAVLARQLDEQDYVTPHAFTINQNVTGAVILLHRSQQRERRVLISSTGDDMWMSHLSMATPDEGFPVGAIPVEIHTAEPLHVFSEGVSRVHLWIETKGPSK